MKLAIPVGTMVELIATLSKVGRTSMDKHIDVWIEPMDRPERHLAVHGDFILVGLDRLNKPTPVPQILDGPTGN